MSFDQAARSINEDWGTTYDGKHIQRYAEHVGAAAVKEMELQRKAWVHGKRPPPKAEAAGDLLVIGMDGGRMQLRGRQAKTESHWVEDKVATISRYRRGDGHGREPERLDTSYIGTLSRSRRFGQLVHVEAEYQGLRETQETMVIGDGAGWIDKIAEEHFGSHPRIVDYFHAAERLCQCAQAVRPKCPAPLARRLESKLHEGKRKQLLRWLEKECRRLGAMRSNDPPSHPRRIVSENLTYFQRHQHQMNYPEYRRRGWPIGSGVTEAGVKQFNKRVKGTEQFWSRDGGEAILALRALWLTSDERWGHLILYRKLKHAA